VKGKASIDFSLALPQQVEHARLICGLSMTTATTLGVLSCGIDATLLMILPQQDLR
jgi:hypothetical protein